MTEFRVKVDRNPGASPEEGPLQQAAAAKSVNAEELMKRRKKIHQQAAREENERKLDDEIAEAPRPPREDLASVEVSLPNGMVVEIGPTPGVALTMRLLHYYGANEFSMADEAITRALMCVRAIDGDPYPTITSPMDRDRLGHRLGDEGIAVVVTTYRTYWPPLVLSELPVLKKTPRM